MDCASLFLPNNLKLMFEKVLTKGNKLTPRHLGSRTMNMSNSKNPFYAYLLGQEKLFDEKKKTKILVTLSF